jgi:hypothetical protein
MDPDSWIYPFDPVAVMDQVECKFRVRISWREFEEAKTMGGLHRLILDKVGRREQQVCVSSATFYCLRRALGEVLGIPRKRVRTNSRMEEFFPVRDRKRHWQHFCAAMDKGHLPGPRRPGWLTNLLHYAFAIGVMVPMFTGGTLHELGYSPWLWGTLLALGIPMGILVLRVAKRLTTRKEICFAPNCKTVRDVVYTLVGQGANPVVSYGLRPNDAEIWDILCGIVGDEFDAQPTSLTLDSHPWAA